MRIYQVGGCVRDDLLGREPRDKDYVVLGATETQFLSAYPRARKVGSGEAVYVHQGEQFTLSREPTIEEDLRRRDLTVNALARGEDGALHALPGALEDLRDRVLRPVAPGNFLADPLRALRAARFCACLPEFSASPELVDLMRSIGRSGLQHRPAAERVGEEVRRACACPRPDRFLFQLARTRLLHPWFRELASPFDGSGSGEVRGGLSHVARVMELCAGDERRVWMAMCHHLEGKEARDRGAYALPAYRMGVRLRLPGRFIHAGAAAARWHGAAARYPDLPAGTRLDLLLGLHRAEALEEVFVLAWIHTGRDLLCRARKDLRAVLGVRLPRHQRDLGRQSGEKLRQLRLYTLVRRDAGRHPKTG